MLDGWMDGWRSLCFHSIRTELAMRMSMVMVVYVRMRIMQVDRMGWDTR